MKPVCNMHVPAEMHIYQNGGHGFGMHLPKSKDLWMERCLNWMTANGWLKSYRHDGAYSVVPKMRL